MVVDGCRTTPQLVRCQRTASCNVWHFPCGLAATGKNRHGLVWHVALHGESTASGDFGEAFAPKSRANVPLLFGVIIRRTP